MLATHADAVPRGPEWAHEVKWDGWRIIAEITGGQLRLFSRSERDVTSSFPELQGIVLPDLVLDGEVVALDEHGVPSLHALADRIAGPVKAGRARPRPVTVMLFDVLRLEGRELLDVPWAQRRELLEALAPSLDHERWAVPDVYDDGELLLEVTAQNGLEGVVSKRRDSLYLPGQRSRAWLKRPHRRTRSVVVGGWRYETNGRDRLGAVLVGAPQADGRLRLLGRVGAGLAGEAGGHLREQLADLTCDDCPFDDVPREDAAGAIWVRPEVVIDVESLGFAAHGRLRQPAYRGLRPDLTAADVPVEDPADLDTDVDGGASPAPRRADDESPPEEVTPGERAHDNGTENSPARAEQEIRDGR